MRFPFRHLALPLIAVLLFPGTAPAASTPSAGKTGKGTKPAASKKSSAPKKPVPRDLSRVEASIEVTHGGQPLGTIVLRFFYDVAPNHVRNFVELADSGFYDGTHIHRVVPGFVAQGGDPLSKTEKDRSRHGQGFVEDAKGKPVFLRAELSSRPHRRGTLSMARGTNLDSASSQFFLCLADQPQLDHQYTVFGEIASGLEILDRIAAVPRDGRDNPIADVVVRKVEIRETPLPGGAASATASAATPTPREAASGSTAVGAPKRAGSTAPAPPAVNRSTQPVRPKSTAPSASSRGSAAPVPGH